MTVALMSDREFEMMKTHTTLGGQSLEAALRKFPNVKFLQMAREPRQIQEVFADFQQYLYAAGA